MVKIGLILGNSSGFHSEIAQANIVNTDSAFDKPDSSVYFIARNNVELYFLFRNEINSNNSDNKPNHKANIYALHTIGCKFIISTSECQSLQEELLPGEIIVVDQFINVESQNEISYNDVLRKIIINKESLSKPFSDVIRNSLIEACIRNKITTHTRGTAFSLNGLRQATRAESNLYRRLGADVVNTVCAQESMLAHELKINYAALSLCTCFDAWRTDIPPATIEEMQELAESKKDIIKEIILHSTNILSEE